ncbi:SRPBCC family protein [Stappia sp.]|uniref:SRPBCC family protein n=1 Tax=Stappia sp. TaxID=1870903 RepID=UPI003A999597
MSDGIFGESETGQGLAAELRFEFDLDAPPEKVWRALSLAEFRARWLPGASPDGEEAVTVVSEREASYRMREPEPPFLESTVTFRIEPNGSGGTRLRIRHELTDVRLKRRERLPANSDPCLMLAA